ncbi:TIGR03564 family F420-dependent LLM class oxidoreductase [Luteipulveratus halotolerans]|uniref:Luciferase-like domain-containing protein n=1 Tax=Luteipulveratus halotolerans TaxID=1631356 RepID=A0A0L6CJ87_9MICO|nr:TIGR03564 family F420-dependent LLM class oxidoreductase [Luteipulveratus halotolerans]KNX37861.1 hypothetical protein VV01_12975 [Luteipulveratus halotolerans]
MSLSLPLGVARWPRPGAVNAVHDVIDQARTVHDLGVDAVWFGQTYDLDSLSLAATVGASVPGLRVGTSVVPINPRHPVVVASQAMTAQAASHGRFTLGLGLGGKALEQRTFGLTTERPIARLREYLRVLHDLIEGDGADFEGETLTARPVLPTTVAGGSGVPVLVAAMGPQAVRATGELADGSIPFLAGPRFIGSRLRPDLDRTAARAGRPTPTIAAGVVTVVTDDVETVRATALEQMAFYETLPSYRAVLDAEGAERAADMALIGDEETVAAGLQRYADAGVTEIYATQTDLGGPQSQRRTWELLGALRGRARRQAS